MKMNQSIGHLERLKHSEDIVTKYTESQSSSIIIVGCLRVQDLPIANKLFQVHSKTAMFNGKTSQNEHLWNSSSAETDNAYKPLGRGSMDTVLSKILGSLRPEPEHHGRGYEPRRHKSETLCGTGTNHPARLTLNTRPFELPHNDLEQ